MYGESNRLAYGLARQSYWLPTMMISGVPSPSTSAMVGELFAKLGRGSSGSVPAVQFAYPLRSTACE